MSREEVIKAYLDYLIKDPVCELTFEKDYEMLIKVVLSAQTTDKRVNEVGKILFSKFKTLEELSKASIEEIYKIIYVLGSGHKKSEYVKNIATDLIEKFSAKVPNTMEELITLNGVGRKSANVVLGVLFSVPAIAVDTHVERVSKRLGLAVIKASPLEVESSLREKFREEDWIDMHQKLVLFGRYYCKAIKPECSSCQLRDICLYEKKNN